MTVFLIQQRLNSQLISRTPFDRPEQTVAHLGMLQAQDYLGALWAVGLRTLGGSEAQVEEALAGRQIVRTWPARGTLHFTAAGDARWLLDLLGLRAIRAAASRFAQLELDEAVFARCREVFTAALQGGRRLTRAEMYALLEPQDISTAGQRGIHILWRLALEGVLCFGPRQGKQHTFVLLDEWLPPAAPRPRDEALAALALRYFSGHGPATLKDFAWWSGLNQAEAKDGLEMAKGALVEERGEGQSWWLAPSTPGKMEPVQDAHLLPAFDEYLVGYQARSREAVLDPGYARQINAGGGILNPAIVIDGQVSGVWKRTLKKGKVTVSPSWFSPPDDRQIEAFSGAARRYAQFLGLKLSEGKLAEGASHENQT